MSSILEEKAVRDAAMHISVEQYHQLGEAGIIDRNTELLRGIVVEKMIKSPEHSWIVQLLVDWFRAHVGDDVVVRQEQPLTFARSEPEPDVAVVKGSAADFRATHPATALLVIEVAITSVELDRQKCADYAEAGVQEYWLVLPNEEAIEVFSSPAGGQFQKHEHFGPGDTIRIKSPIRLEFPVDTIFDA